MEEVEIPKTKEEKKRLAQRFSKNPQDRLQVTDGRCTFSVHVRDS